MYCSNCGSKLAESDSVCPSCGQCLEVADLPEEDRSDRKKRKISKPVIIICVLLLAAVCVLLTLPPEIRGVPDSVICRDANYDIDSAAKYDVIHNVDTDAHIDDAQLKLVYKGDYGTKTITVPYSYEYSKSDDSWTLLEKGDATSEYVLDEKAYKEKSPFLGKIEGSRECTYSITFQKINMEEMYAVISYDIDFAKKSIPDISGFTTVALEDSYGLYFLIEYTYPGAWSSDQETLWFWLNIDKGIDTSLW